MLFRFIPSFVSLAFIIFLLAGSAQAYENPVSINLQGATGLLTIPSAEVTSERRGVVQVNDYIDRRFVQQAESARNILFSFGFLPYLEVGGRQAVVRGEGGRRIRNDLSGNIKLQLPLPDSLPHIAVGAYDFDGEAPNFRSRYAVATQAWKDFKLTLGRGVGPDLMKGNFAGIQWQVTEWLDLLLEREVTRNHMGLRLHKGIPGWPKAGLNVLLRYGPQDEADEYSLAIGLSFPLGRSDKASLAEPLDIKDRSQDLSSQSAEPKDFTEAKGDGSRSSLKEKKIHIEHPEPVLGKLEQRLSGLGFQGIRLGVDDKGTLYCEFENIRYNHSAMDGLGLVLGVLAVESPKNVQRLNLRLLENGVPLIQIRVDVAKYKDFLKQPLPNAAKLKSQMTITHVSKGYGETGIRWYMSGIKQPKTRITAILQPNIRTYIGTEVGALDYSSALRSEFRIRLWSGGLAHFSHDIPIAHTDSFDDYRVFANSRHKSRIDNAFVGQLLKPASSLYNLTSVGFQYFGDERYQGVWNETQWLPGSGEHRARLKLGRFENELDELRRLWVVSYRFQYSPLDLQLEVSKGRYWYGDEGKELVLRRFFGDTAISFFVKSGMEQAGGIRISLPLTPRRAPNSGFLQVRGTSRWAYGTQTSINLERGQGNVINEAVVVEPFTSYNLLKDVLDSDRLNPSYIKQHIFRLRDAYITWGEETGEIE